MKKKSNIRNRDKPINNLDTPQKRIFWIFLFAIILGVNFFIASSMNADAAQITNHMVPVIATETKSSTGTENLSMTFFDIIKCAGCIAFLWGYAEFVSALQNGDASNLLPQGKKMFAGIILANTKWFLVKCKVWDNISSGKAVAGVGDAINMICNCSCMAITVVGVIGLMIGIQKFGTALSEKDMVGMRHNMMALCVNLLVIAVGGFATALGFASN